MDRMERKSLAAKTNMEKVKIRVVNTAGYDLPQYATASAAGLDLKAALKEPVVLAPLQRALVPTGLFLEIPPGMEAQVRPRSGLALKQGITVLNTPGTIDADYRGEVGVILINLGSQPAEINPGDRVAQLVFARYEQINWEPARALSETERGSGGFGHTGKE